MEQYYMIDTFGIITDLWSLLHAVHTWQSPSSPNRVGEGQQYQQSSRSKAVDPLFSRHFTSRHNLTCPAYVQTGILWANGPGMWCYHLWRVLDILDGINENFSMPTLWSRNGWDAYRITRTRVSDMLNNLLVSCPLDCQMMVWAENFNKHLKSWCKDFYESSRVTTKEMMSRSSDIPMTPQKNPWWEVSSTGWWLKVLGVYCVYLPVVRFVTTYWKPSPVDTPPDTP